MITYIVESTLILLLLLGAYKLLLEGEKAYQFNRFFLIGALIFGLTAPLISVDINIFNSVPRVEYESFQPLVAENELPVMQTESTDRSTDTATSSASNAEQSDKPVAAEIKEENSISLSDILVIGYLLGLGFMGFRFILGLRTLLSSLSEYETTVYKGTKIFLIDHSISPFTVFSRIFMSKEDFETGEISETILEHELTHARQLHTLDVILIEVLKIVFWFNPVFYFYKSAIQLNHEFIADENVISNSKDVVGYQKLILNMVSRSSGLSLSSNFNYPSTKKRFKMMIKQFSPLRSYSKKMALLPFFVVITLTFCTKSEHSSGFSSSSYQDVELSAIVVNDGAVFGGSVLRYKELDGNYYTGTRNHYSKASNELTFSDEFEDGYRVATIVYDENGVLSYRYEFEYENSNLIARRKFNKSDILIEEWTAPINRKPGSIKEWHPNEQLKFEGHYLGNLEYEGLMTLYDKEGEILGQERYEDGELVETIKESEDL